MLSLAYSAGEHVLFTSGPSAPEVSPVYALGTIVSVADAAASQSLRRSGSLRRSYSGPGGGLGLSYGATGGGPGDREYTIRPQLACRLVSSKKSPGKQLLRVSAYDPVTDGSEPLLGGTDLAELNERRLQLQMDVDTSRARVEEIKLYVSSVKQQGAAELQQTKTDCARADKAVQLARAALRTAKPAEWRQLCNPQSGRGSAGGGKGVVQTAVAEAVIALAEAQDADESELAKRVIGLKAKSVFEHNRKGLRRAEACLAKYPARSVPAERALLTNAYRWMQAVVAAAGARQTLADVESDGQDDPSAADERGRKSGRPSAQRPSSTGRRSRERQAETAKLAVEQQEHEEYLAVAEEELQAIDDLLHESRAALKAREGATALQVLTSQIAGVVPMNAELAEALRAAGSSAEPHAPVRVASGLGRRIVDALKHHRTLSAALNCGPAPAPRSPFQRSSSRRDGSYHRSTGSVGDAPRENSASPAPAGVQPASARASGRTGSASRRRSPRNSAGAPTLEGSDGQTGGSGDNSRGERSRSGGGGGSSFPQPSPSPNVSALPVSRISRHASAVGSLQGTLAAAGGSELNRQDSTDGSLRDRFDRIHRSPRTSTPKVGAPLLDEAAPGASVSGSATAGSPVTRSASGVTAAYADGGGGRASVDSVSGVEGPVLLSSAALAQERLRAQQRVSELEIKLERALQANPKEAELQLLRDELKGTTQDLRRVTEERDKLLTERRERAQQYSVVDRLRGRRSVAAASESDESVSNPDTADWRGERGLTALRRRDPSTVLREQGVIEELEDQLSVAHRRIQELEANYQRPGTTAGESVSARAMDTSTAEPSSPLGVDGYPAALADDEDSTPSPAALAAARAQTAAALAQLSQEQQLRAQQQTRLDVLQLEVESGKQNARKLEEQLNSALHAREESQAQVAQQRKELDVMWAKLEDTEAKLQDEQERASRARAQNELAAEGGQLTNGGMSLPSVVNAAHHDNLSVSGIAAATDQSSSGAAAYFSESPMNPLPWKAVQGLATGSGNPNHTNNNLQQNGSGDAGVLGEDEGNLSRASSPMPSTGRDASQSPQPIPTGTPSVVSASARLGAPSGGSAATANAQAVEAMSAVELRHEVRQLRQEVEALQSTELRLTTLLSAAKEQQREDRQRRQQARSVRLQMLCRLEEAVQQAMDGGAQLAEVPDFVERAKEETDRIVMACRQTR